MLPTSIQPINKNSGGFTIVELLIVIVVIAILAAITIMAYNGIQQRARDTQMLSDLTSAAKKLELYNAESGRYPTNAGEAATAKIRFSFSPVGNDVLLCGNASGYAVVAQRNSKQYIVQTGQAAKELLPQVSWSSGSICATTPYPGLSWGNFFVDGG